MAGGFDAGAFQDDAFAITFSMQIDVTEQQDTASFSASAWTSASFTVSEAQDTASFAADAKTYVSFAIVEASDHADFAAGIVGTATFALTDQPDTASFKVRSADKRFVEFDLVEPNPDTAQFDASSTTTAYFELQENSDTASFTSTSTTYASFALVEPSDVASFRSFHFFYDDSDAHVIVVPFQPSRVDLLPGIQATPIAPQSSTGYIPDEWQRVDVDQHAGARRKE